MASHHDRLVLSIALAIFLAAGLVLTPSAAANEIDFNPSTGVFTTLPSSLGDCGYPAPLSTYVENGIQAYTYCAGTNIQNLIVPVSGNSGVYALASGQFFTQTDITLTDFAPFEVVSFKAAGCNGTLSAYNAAGVPIPGDGFAFTNSCSGLGSFTVDWTGVTYLVLYADSGVPEPPVFLLTDVVITPSAPTVPEPESSWLILTGLAGIPWLRDRMVRKALRSK